MKKIVSNQIKFIKEEESRCLITLPQYGSTWYIYCKNK